MKSKTYNLKFRAADRNIFEAIRQGRKKVETRAATTRYKDIKTGDTVILACGKEKFKKIIRSVKIFKTISAMLQKYSIKDINPDITTEEELQNLYFSFSGYKEKIKKYGLIAIELA